MKPGRTRSVGRSTVTSLCKSVRSPKFWFCLAMWLYLSSLVLLSLSVSADKRVRPHVECEHARDCQHVPRTTCQDVPRTTCRAGLCACVHRLEYYTMEPKGCYHPDERYDAIQQLHKYDREEKMVMVQNFEMEIYQPRLLPDTSCLEYECRCPKGQQYFQLPESGCYTADARKQILNKQVTRLNRERAKQERGETFINDNSVYLSNQPPKIHCTKDTDCSDFEYAVCGENGTCRCKRGDLFYGWGENIGCYGVDRPEPQLSRSKRSVPPRPLEQVGDMCEDHEECRMENSGCHPLHKVCACLPRFTRSRDGQCDPVEFGSACPTDGSDDSFCRRFLTRSVCIYGKCGCPELYPIRGASYDGHPACLSTEFDQTARKISEHRSRLGDSYPGLSGAGRAGP